MEVTLRIYSRDGTQEIPLTGGRLTIGRTDEADVAINDSGLSRIHASINRDGDRLWVIDEGSTNGTFVNRQPVAPTGTPLVDGNEIDLGSSTITIVCHQGKQATAVAGSMSNAGTPPGSSTSGGIPIKLIAGAISVVVVLCAAIIIGTASRNRNNNNPTIAVRKSSPQRNGADTESPNATPKPDTSQSVQPSPDPSTETDNSATIGLDTTPTRRYLSMTPDEQRQFVARESQHVARMIGNREGYAFTPEVVSKIKIWVDAYARRLHSPRPSGGCNMRHDLRTLLERAHTHAPLVVKAFNEKGLSAQVGLYLAMIESEYCPCLSSGTGAKGMFQFVGTTARRYGVPFVTANSRDTAPDDRCRVEVMAPIAAQYMKDLIAMFGTGPLSVPLAIASYNEGEGGLTTNLIRALNAAKNSDNPERSFWTMVANADMMSDQFQREAIKYVPHFFGAAIVGENPRVFGVELGPISSNTEELRKPDAGQ